MNELIELLNEHLDEDLQGLNYSGYLLKKITSSSAISVNKESKGYHIEITDTDGPMNLFPVVTSSRYLSTRDTQEKRRFTLKLPLSVSAANIVKVADSVESRAIEKELTLKVNSAELQALKNDITTTPHSNEFTICTFNQRSSGQSQSEIGTSKDSKFFLGLRSITLPGEYLLFLKIKNTLKYVTLSIPNLDDIEGVSAFFEENGVFQISEKENSQIEGAEVNELVTELESNYLNKKSNIIYYGPPGTGKTREIQINHLAGKDDSNSKFITFHQSYSYEEFIEGLKPQVIHGHEPVYDNTNLRDFIKYSIDALLGDLSWVVMSQNIQETDSTINANQYRGLRFPDFFGANNLFGKFESPQTTTSLSSSGTQRFFETPIASNANENVYLTTQWGDVEGDGLTYKNFQRFISKISGGLYSSIKKDGKYVLTQRSESNSNVIYKIMKGVFYDACESAARLAGYSSLQECISDTVEKRSEKLDQAIASNNVFVMCIDEINRANISSVFGDLITLIEEKKRLGGTEEMAAILPYSKEKFGVPKNLQIIGSMNTADRSITLLDSALRRRFHFEEMLPRPEILKEVEIDGINVSKLLEKINRRITYFLGKDQSIGHSYFIGLEKSTTPKKDLLSIFWNNIIPLLEEYFYNDIPKIRLVLGENNKSEHLAFYKLDEEADIEQLFGNIEEDIDVDEETSTFEKNSILLELSTLGEESQIDKDIFIKVYA